MSFRYFKPRSIHDTQLRQDCLFHLNGASVSLGDTSYDRQRVGERRGRACLLDQVSPRRAFVSGSDNLGELPDPRLLALNELQTLELQLLDVETIIEKSSRDLGLSQQSVSPCKGIVNSALTCIAPTRGLKDELTNLKRNISKTHNRCG